MAGLWRWFRSLAESVAPAKPAAGPEELRFERLYLEAGQAGAAKQLVGRYTFPITVERAWVWLDGVERHMTRHDSQGDWCEHLDPLVDLAVALRDDGISSTVCIRAARCSSTGLRVAIQMVDLIVDPELKADLIRCRLLPRLTGKWMDIILLTEPDLMRLVVPYCDEAQLAAIRKGVLTAGDEAWDCFRQLTGDLSYSVEEYLEVISNQAWRAPYGRFAAAYPSEWSEYVRTHVDALVFDGVECGKLVQLVTTTDLIWLRSQLEEAIESPRVKPERRLLLAKHQIAVDRVIAQRAKERRR